MGTVSAYFPTLFGSPGLLLSCRDEFLKSHHIWSCFSPTPNLNSKQLVYMGEYKLRFIDQLSQEEYDGQTDEAKKRNAYLIFDFIVRQLGPMQKYDKHFKHAGVSLLEAKFADGRERIRIFVIEHVGYDSRFAQVVQTQYDDWEEKQMKERGAAMGENDGTETTEEE
ncbi:hypothetical protein HYDPIDRAFT_27345 [Hydnomerulius pinastri MD-312]|nr:hypothetical protein HYDPIDRAFT_27345 [Hydnomerulius pinastri MD-312]